MENLIGAYIILVGRPEGKRKLGRPTRRWTGNIGMDRREMGWEGVRWMYLAEDIDQMRGHLNAVMNLWVP
jgi:hypothetical protein